jgi:hypothetical protein
MTYRGRVKPNGLIELEPGNLLPAGSEVAVRLLRSRAAANGKQLKKGRIDHLMKFAGKARGLPKDASRNLDHYLYGHPKR